MKKNTKSSFLFFTIILSVGIISLFDSDNQLKQLQILYRNFEYEQTIKLAEIMLKNPNITKQEKVKTYVIKGVAEYSSNQTLKARQTFIELLLFDKNVSLDEKEISPKIIEFFNRLKEKLSVTGI